MTLAIFAGLALFAICLLIPLGGAEPLDEPVPLPVDDATDPDPTSIVPSITLSTGTISADVSQGDDTVVIHGNVTIPTQAEMQVSLRAFYLDSTTWPMVLEPDQMTFTLTGETFQKFTLTITVNASAMARETATAVVNGTWTTSLLSGFLKPDQVAVRVLQHFEIEATADEGPTSPQTLSTTVFSTIYVANHGNGEDRIQAQIDNNVAPGFTFDMGSSVDVNPSEVGQIEISVTPSADIPEGVTTVNVEVFSTADLTNVHLVQMHLVVVEDRFVISFGPRGFILLTGGSGFNNFEAGEILDAKPLSAQVTLHCFIAEVRNIQIMTLAPIGLTVTPDTPTVNMSAGQTRTVQLTFGLDDTVAGNFSERRMLGLIAEGVSGSYTDVLPETVRSNPIIYVVLVSETARTDSGFVLPLVPTIVGSAGTALILGAAAAVATASTEAGRYKFLALAFVPLYTKLHHDKILDHFSRGRIYEFIKLNPGCTLTDIKEELNLSNGKVTYHLVTLEREELVKSRRDGRFRVFYLTGIKIEQPSTVSELIEDLAGIDKTIYELIMANPGTTQKEIVSELSDAMDLAPRTVSSHIKAMQRSGIIEMRKDGRVARCYPIAS